MCHPPIDCEASDRIKYYRVSLVRRAAAAALLLFFCGNTNGHDAGAGSLIPEVDYLEAEVSVATGAESELRIGRRIALGAVAFNSPYLFGGAALHDSITCAACHDRSGPTGPAAKLTFVAPIPDLTSHEWPADRSAGNSPESFVRRAIMKEFSGPPPDRDTVIAIGAYIRQFEPSSVPGDRILIKAVDLARLCVALLGDAARQKSLQNAGFLVETARFAIGQAAASSSHEDLDKLMEANALLKRLGDQTAYHPRTPDWSSIENNIFLLETALFQNRRWVLTSP